MTLRKRIGMISAVALSALLVITAVVLISRPASDEVAQKIDDAFLNAFRSSEAEFRELTVQCWGKIDNEFHDSASLQVIYEKLIAAAGGENDMLREEYSDSFYSGITVKGHTGTGFYLEMMVQSISDNYEEDETYLIVNLAEKGNYEELNRIIAQGEAFFEAAGAKAETQILLSASYNEILSQRAKKQVAERIFKDGGGNIIEGVDEETYMSRSGFYPSLGEGVISAGKEINLQIAMFDNEVDGETWLYLGSPLVFSEY